MNRTAIAQSLAAAIASVLLTAAVVGQTASFPIRPAMAAIVA